VDIPPDFKKVAICGGCDERFPSVTGWMEEAKALRVRLEEEREHASYMYITVGDYEAEVGLGVSQAFKYGFKVARLKEGGT